MTTKNSEWLANKAKKCQHSPQQAAKVCVFLLEACTVHQPNFHTKKKHYHLNLPYPIVIKPMHMEVAAHRVAIIVYFLLGGYFTILCRSKGS